MKNRFTNFNNGVAIVNGANERTENAINYYDIVNGSTQISSLISSFKSFKDLFRKANHYVRDVARYYGGDEFCIKFWWAYDDGSQYYAEVYTTFGNLE